MPERDPCGNKRRICASLRRLTLVALLCLSAIFAAPAPAIPLQIKDGYSPRNSARPVRPHTLYIVLHTTEGSGASALRKLRRYGEAHYLVDRSGVVHRIIHRDRIALHAGTSLWDGHAPLDRYSIGVEVAGYHDGSFEPVQLDALRELLRQLRSLYRIAARDVLTHSMVAYGLPNRFHADDHRGRKRCAMAFARPELRARLGLEAGPARDPEVAAGVLRVGDKELFGVLFPHESTLHANTPATSLLLNN